MHLIRHMHYIKWEVLKLGLKHVVIRLMITVTPGMEFMTNYASQWMTSYLNLSVVCVSCFA